MRYLLSSKEMKQADETTINQYKIPGAVLMERAALAVCAYLKKVAKPRDTIGIVCGTGNNGGDAFAVARLLHQDGYQVSLYLVGETDKMTQECKLQYDICQAYQVPFVSNIDALLCCDFLIDGLFGIGLKRELKDIYYDVITACNEAQGKKIAIDMPSGISADDGSVLGVGFQADVTITFGYEKVGQYLFPGKAYCGKVITADIGITDASIQNTYEPFKRLEKKDLSQLPKAKVSDHKGSKGKLLLIAGSETMAGAAYLAAHSAMVAGCGVLKIYTASCNRDILLTKLPEAIVESYDTFEEKKLLQLIQWSDGILLGPGMGTSTTAKKIVLSVLKNATVPIVLDADGLRIVAGELQVLKYPHTSLVITPHMGEMSYLTNNSIFYLKEHKIEAAREVAQTYQVTCVLKDADTVIAVPNDDTYINSSGTPALATAGSGDVLAGLIASLMTQGVPEGQAAALGVFVHGLAAKKISKKTSIQGMVASDIIKGIKRIYKERGI